MRRVSVKVLSVLIAAAVLLTNARLHRPGGPATTAAQLDFLAARLADGGGERMQRWFPEGYVFTWSLYGLAAAQLVRDGSLDDTERDRQRQRALDAVGAVRSDLARSTFPTGMAPPRGAFYSAWSLYVLAEYVRAVGPEAAGDELLTMFREESDAFSDALSRSESPFLESYPSAAWPADTAVGVAALGIYDQVVEPRYQPTIRRWVEAARQRVDPGTGGLAHHASPSSGAPLGGARGGSLALMSRVLVDADRAFAAEQYGVLREHFVDYRWGLPGVREYPHGVEGEGDVDSGPVVLGFAGPAVVVGAAAARVYGDVRLSDILLGTVEAFGLPIHLPGGRRYALGFVPVGDAFIAWARSTPAGSTSWAPILPGSWHVPVHLVSALLLLLLALRVHWALRASDGGV